MLREIHRLPVQVVDKTRPVRQTYVNYNFSSDPFWTQKIETKIKYICISNILLLLREPDSIPHGASVLACLVVELKQCVSFPVDNDLKFDCCLMHVYIQSKCKEIQSFLIVSWTKFCKSQWQECQKRWCL